MWVCLISSLDQCLSANSRSLTFHLTTTTTTTTHPAKCWYCKLVFEWPRILLRYFFLLVRLLFQERFLSFLPFNNCTTSWNLLPKFSLPHIFGVKSRRPGQINFSNWLLCHSFPPLFCYPFSPPGDSNVIPFVVQGVFACNSILPGKILVLWDFLFLTTWAQYVVLCFQRVWILLENHVYIMYVLYHGYTNVTMSWNSSKISKQVWGRTQRCIKVRIPYFEKAKSPEWLPVCFLAMEWSVNQRLMAGCSGRPSIAWLSCIVDKSVLSLGLSGQIHPKSWGFEGRA